MKERALGLLGRKIGMTSIFDAERTAKGVTVVELGPCKVMAKLEEAKAGYNALQLGFGTRKAKHCTKPQLGQLKALGGEEHARRYIRELRVTKEILEKFSVGQEISLSDLGLKAGAKVDITGVTKGKGFQGVMKRHNFGGYPATHGTHEYFRHGGSIGCRKWPGRVYKGRKMAGHMGDEVQTTQNVKIAAVREADNVLLLQGAVSGGKGCFVVLRPAIK